MNGGKPVYVPLRPPSDASDRVVSSHEWKLDVNELRSKITSRTKIIVVNTPHNPVGKVFDEDELRAIGQVAEEHNLIILSDEVVTILGKKKKQILVLMMFIISLSFFFSMIASITLL